MIRKGKEWCQGKADTAPTASLQPLESSGAFFWQGKELVERQQLLSASLLHKKNMETNHCKLSLLLSVGGKRKCSFVFFSSLPFFLLFFTFANKTHLTGSPSLELLPPAPKPSLWNAAHGSAQLQGQDKATSCSSPGCPRCSGTARARASPGAGAEPGHSRALHPRERPGKSREGEGDYLELQEQFQGAGSCWLCRHRHREARGLGALRDGGQGCSTLQNKQECSLSISAFFTSEQLWVQSPAPPGSASFRT